MGLNKRCDCKRRGDPQYKCHSLPTEDVYLDEAYLLVICNDRSGLMTDQKQRILVRMYTSSDKPNIPSHLLLHVRGSTKHLGEDWSKTEKTKTPNLTSTNMWSTLQDNGTSCRATGTWGNGFTFLSLLFIMIHGYVFITTRNVISACPCLTNFIIIRWFGTHVFA